MRRRRVPFAGRPRRRSGHQPTATRRRVLGSAGLLALASLAGCSGGSGRAADDADVVAGPGGRLTFEPDTLTVAVGDAVTWFFDSAGHNVCGRPTDSDLAVLPAGAEPYATYGAGASPLRTVARGETFEHRFSVPGTYGYSCVPHESAGMVGRVRVE